MVTTVSPRSSARKAERCASYSTDTTWRAGAWLGCLTIANCSGAEVQFFEAVQRNPRDPVATSIVARMDELFAVDAEARRKALSTAARHIRRQETAKPLLGDIRSKIEAAQSVALPSSAVGKACQYALTLWRKLTRFLEYPELELSNNLAENSMPTLQFTSQLPRLGFQQRPQPLSVSAARRDHRSFGQDIIHKGGYALTKRMLNPDILFHHINSQEEVDSARKYNAQFDGVGLSQLDGFAKLLATSSDKLEETFHNIEIRQDGPLGLVTFNFDFVVNDKVTHSGVDHWQVCKIDGQWKILSVAWTIYP